MCRLVNNSEFEKQCYYVSHNWFVVDDVDFTVVDGVSIGKVVQLQIFEKLFESSQINADSNDIRSIIKKMNLEWVVRAFASRFDSVKDDKQTDILFVYDVNNGPMIHALNVIGLSLEKSGHSVLAVVVDKTIANKCKLARKISWFKSLAFLDLFQAVKSSFKLNRVRARNFEKYFYFLVSTCGLKKARRVHRYFKWQSSQLLLELRVIRSLLRNKKPAVVVLASDAHRVSRMVVLLCKTMGIRTVVYQHGATIWEYGYVPVFADRMLVWGEASKQWFTDRGVNAEQLIEVGNLRSDEVGYKALTEMDFLHKKKVYFFPNPIDRKITDDVISRFISICENYELDGVLKLHPSEKNLKFFEERISGVKQLIRISTDPISEAGINPGDVAIVVNSTAGVDFCLEGGYVLNIEIDSMPNPIDYEGFGVGIKTGMETCLDDFERLIVLLPEDYLKNRKEFIRSYLGDLDGKVKDRACNVIDGLVRYGSE